MLERGVLNKASQRVQQKGLLQQYSQRRFETASHSLGNHTVKGGDGLPYLSSVFNKPWNLQRKFIRCIEPSVNQEDICFYISTELAKILEKLDLPMPANGAPEAERSFLMEKSGTLFVYAATPLRFTSDDPVQDPRGYPRLMLDTRPVQDIGATPCS
jgi:hypothetical protein